MNAPSPFGVHEIPALPGYPGPGGELVSQPRWQPSEAGQTRSSPLLLQRVRARASVGRHSGRSQRPLTRRCLACICRCPGVGGELRLPEPPRPNPRGLHDTTPTATSCHLSQVMEIERATRSGCSASQPALPQSPGQHWGRGAGSPTAEQLCMSPAGPDSGPEAGLQGGRRGGRPRT